MKKDMISVIKDTISNPQYFYSNKMLTLKHTFIMTAILCSSQK